MKYCYKDQQWDGQKISTTITLILLKLHTESKGVHGNTSLIQIIFL